MSDRSVGFIVVNAIDLGETMHDEMSFILIDLACSVLLYFEDPLAINDIDPFWWVRYDVPRVSFSKAFEFGIDHLFPSWPVRCIHASATVLGSSSSVSQVAVCIA